MQFYKQLKTWGWDKKHLNLCLLQLTNNCNPSHKERTKTHENEISTLGWMILHLEYHPDNIRRKIVCDLWSEHCCKYLSKDIEDGGLGIKQTIRSYSRQGKWETCYRRQNCTSYLVKKCQLIVRSQCCIILATFFVQEIWIPFRRFLLIYQRVRPEVPSLGSILVQYLGTNTMILDMVSFICHKILATVVCTFTRVWTGSLDWEVFLQHKGVMVFWI